MSPNRLVGRESLLLGVAAAALTGIAIVTALIAIGRDFLFENDAQIFYRIAQHPFGDGSVFDGLRADTGTAYRFGRILYPLVAWMLAFGRAGWVRWTMPIVYAVGLGAMTTFACELSRRRGATARRGIVVLATPAFLLTAPVLFAEPFVASLVLLVFLLAYDGRGRATRVAAAALLLARESMAVALIPLVWRGARKDGWRGVARWVPAVLPLAAWSVWVRMRMGSFPITDPSYGRTGALALPFIGPATVVREGGADSGLFLMALVLVGATVIAGVWAWRRGRGDSLSAAAFALAVVALFLGPGAWRIPGAAIRSLLPAQALIIVSLAGRSSADRTQERGPRSLSQADPVSYHSGP